MKKGSCKSSSNGKSRPRDKKQHKRDRRIGNSGQGDSSDDICTICSDPAFFLDYVCPLSFLNAIGIFPKKKDGIWTIEIPDKIVLDQARIEGSIDQINSQMPGGSFSGYISRMASGASSAVGESLTAVLLTMIFLVFFLFSTTFMVLIAYSIVGAALGVTMILMGLLFSVMTFLLAYSLISGSISQVAKEVEPIVDTIKCAILSGTCCYSGISCCCPGGSNSPCKNPAIPPSINGDNF